MAPSEPLNRLATETSPYLLQHAHNPVQWHPWDAQALGKARRENKPILLSIGYSACHWCHVMAHESFENAETAALMNELFVNIKVDREERPDLDRIYQIAHQMLAQRSGGWPLTMFLSPDDLTPFFGGTYFPPEPRHGLPGFRDVLRQIAQFYHDNPDDLRKQNAALREVFTKLEPPPADERARLTRQPLLEARRILEAEFDSRQGGFGRAPKFPHPTSIAFLIQQAERGETRQDPDRPALRMALFTLTRMAEGGIYDHLGGGFSRYAVDAAWMIPHFEKMLYDNGPLLGLYAHAWRLSGDEYYRQVTQQTAQWAMREMQSPEGGFYSSLDADSEGREGKYYVWTREEARIAMTEDEYAVFARRYGLDGESNFEDKWHLHAYHNVPALARALDMNETDVAELLESAHAKLFALRERRVRPGRDDKILTSWNALMIKGLATAGRLLDDQNMLDAATRALDFIRATLWRDDRLLASYKDGRARFNAYLDDYAYLADAALELLQARWRTQDLVFVQALADAMLAHFEDQEGGGFYFTSADHEELIHRPKPLSDDATPSGNGIAAHVLLRLGHLLGRPVYLDAAERTLRAALPLLTRYPQAHIALLLALDEYLEPGETIVLRGKPETMRAWHKALARRESLNSAIYRIPADEADLPGSLLLRKPQGDCVAYVCRGMQCSAPITGIENL